MKHTLLLLSFFISFFSPAQTKEIPITGSMFVRLVFDHPILNTKVGAPHQIILDKEDTSITLQSVGMVTNEKTNLSVSTKDGAYYSFIITCKKEVKELFYQIPATSAANYQKNRKNSDEKNTIPFYTTAERISEVRGKTGYLKSRNTKESKSIFFSILGIYSQQEDICFLLKVKNKSHIKYDIDNIEFETSEIKKTGKQVNNIRKKILPKYFDQNLSSVSSRQEKKFVAVFDKFTIANDKKLYVTLKEKNGERTVSLKISANKLSQARNI